MLSRLASSASLFILAAFSLATTGCAAKLHGSAHFGAHVPSVAVALPSPSINAQAQAGAYGQANANAQAQANAQYGGACGPAASPPPPPPQPWRPRPVFYGVPLESAQDVVFVLDRSGSMGEGDGGAPTPYFNPTAVFSFANAIGTRALAAPSSPHAAAALPIFLSAAPASIFAPRTKLETAKFELTTAIAGLPDGTRYSVIFFGDTIASLAPSFVTLNPVSRLGSMAFVQSITPDGSTAAVPALRTAYGLRARRVVFLSDGLANVGGDGQQLLAEARAQMRSGVRFDTVGVGTDQDRPLMATLAAESGGLNTIH